MKHCNPIRNALLLCFGKKHDAQLDKIYPYLLFLKKNHLVEFNLTEKAVISECQCAEIEKVKQCMFS